MFFFIYLKCFVEFKSELQSKNFTVHRNVFPYCLHDNKPFEFFESLKDFFSKNAPYILSVIDESQIHH